MEKDKSRYQGDFLSTWQVKPTPELAKCPPIFLPCNSDSISSVGSKIRSASKMYLTWGREMRR